MRFQVTAGGDGVRSRWKGGGGHQGEIDKDKVVIRHRERCDRES